MTRSERLEYSLKCLELAASPVFQGGLLVREAMTAGQVIDRANQFYGWVIDDPDAEVEVDEPVGFAVGTKGGVL